MSWKSFVSAGLLCILASPVVAQPTLRIINGPALNAQGNWVWNVSIEPAGTSVVAAELGFDANRDVVSATKGAAFTGDNTNIAGNVIFGWETLTGTPPLPEGVQVGTGANIDKVFSALGSNSAAGISGQTPYLTVVTTGPSNTATTGTLQVLGAYQSQGDSQGRPQTGGNQGLIAQESGATSLGYVGFVGTASRTLQAADINLDGTVNDLDASAFGANWQANVTNGWASGDFNRDGIVNDLDASYFGANWQASGGAMIDNLTRVGVLPTAPGAGSGAVSAVPEPASLALVGLGLLGGLGLFRRKR